MNAVSTQQTAVSTLSNDIHVITAEINAYQRVAGEAIFEIGKRLKHVKENDLAHGEWSKWCESIGMSRAQSHKFIKVYERFGNVSPVKQLPTVMSVLFELTPFSDGELTQSREMPDGSTKTLLEMSRREIEEYKREIRKAEQRTELAETARRQAEQRAAEAKHSEEIAMRQLERAEEQLATATKPKEIIVEKPVEKVVTIDNTDYKAVERLKAYEERFGALENYTERVRASNVDTVTTSIVSFNMAVRDFIKRHAYLLKYQDTIQFIDKVTQREYNEAVQALKEISAEFCKVSGIGDYVDVEFSEVNN